MALPSAAGSEKTLEEIFCYQYQVYMVYNIGNILVSEKTGEKTPRLLIVQIDFHWIHELDVHPIIDIVLFRFLLYPVSDTPILT